MRKIGRHEIASHDSEVFCGQDVNRIKLECAYLLPAPLRHCSWILVFFIKSMD